MMDIILWAMRYHPDHKQQTRELVLAEAGKEIRKQGPHKISVASIMKRAGLTHGGFYAHFESKDAMLAAAIEQMFDGSRDRWVTATLDRSPEDGLATYVDWYLAPAHRDSRESGCTVAALASDLPRLSPACQKSYAEGSRRIISRMAAVLAALGRDEPEALAASVFAEMLGALSLARIETDARRSDAILVGSRRAVKRRLGLRP
jgi:TetR/AcrR family transcriptional repressor of nem operon